MEMLSSEAIMVSSAAEAAAAAAAANLQINSRQQHHAPRSTLYVGARQQQ
jgi:hypothetical protein